MSTAALPWRAARPRLRRLASPARRFLSPVKPALSNLASIPLTVAGWALLSACAFSVSTTLGLGASGVVLMVLEHQIADEQ